VLAPAGRAAPPSAPTAAQIEGWVKQLGDNDFVAREEATRKLWEAGDAAEPALRRAARSDDAEVARRAQDILAKFKWGLYPDTPREVAFLVAAYQAATEAPEKADIVRRLLRAGPAGHKAVARVGFAEGNDEVRDGVFDRLRQDLPALMADNDAGAVDALVKTGLYSKKMGPGYYVAWWLLRGRPPEAVAALEALAADPEHRKAAEALAYICRARGDMAAARRAATRARSRELVEALLFEAGDWKGLAKRPELVIPEMPVEQAAFRAAYRRLAGDDKGADEALAEARKLAEAEREPDEVTFLAAKACFLNDRPAEGLEQAARAGRWAVRFEVLAAQQKYREALALTEAAKAAGSRDLPALELLAARTFHLLGEKEKAQAIFTRQADQIREGFDADLAGALVEAEYRAGLKDQAFAHCARVLALYRPDGPPPRFQLRPFLAKVFPDDADSAAALWSLLRRKHEKEAPEKLLRQVRDLLEGKASADKVRELVKEAETGSGLEDGLLRVALADAAQAAGLDELARSCLEKSSAPAALVRLGDLLADKGRWEEAAKRYRQAWEKDRRQPLPLFLSGLALTRAGKAAEGGKVMERAHMLPLGDETVRQSFAQELARRGLREGLRRETEMLRLVSLPESYAFGAAARFQAIEAAGRKDYRSAERAYEQAMLRCLHAWTNFVQPAAYVGVPALAHRLRAAALINEGDAEGARREVRLAQNLTPGNIDLAILLVPALEKRGLTGDADKLFADTLAVYERLCKEYPRCAWAHNSAAWLSACCRRNLDGALAHARKAVELGPDTPSYLDTQAEVHFQRGEKDQAVALQKRVISLDPKKGYYRKQLKRLEAGDPRAELPDEDDE
jgi:tetratricopeptide (TPR) repeat protein